LYQCSLLGVRFQSPSHQHTMDRLNVHHVKECAAVLRATLTAMATALEAKGAGEKTPLEQGEQFALQTAFTHNDLLSGNVLIPLDFFEAEGVDSMRFIDYEYAGYNARAFDLANHFCGKNNVKLVYYLLHYYFIVFLLLYFFVTEYAGFSFDMDADFPKSDHRRLFIRHYLRGCIDQLGDLGSLADNEEFLSGFEVF
jgi:thiamine kinase-like enzyme